MINLRPDLGSQGADFLRGVFGDQLVADVETAFFQAQDRFSGVAYRLGTTHPAAPWAAAAVGSPTISPTSAATVLLAPSARAAVGTAPLRRTPTAPPPTAVAATPTAPAWLPPPLPASDTLSGAGQWSAYLRDSVGQTLAYRAFLQPDPERPYAIAAIVAFDLHAIQLHFVLGIEEPRSPVAIPRTGKIPLADVTSGRLLAAFNGGFKARHGQFGAMVDGTIALPPKAGFATVAMYRDGRVRIGAWGTDIVADPDLMAWRQNGPLVIAHGQITPQTDDTTSHDWGIILNGVTAVWRSGLGISADGRTLYYIAGNSLTLPALVRTLAATGATAALQLDINIGMVHFDALQSTPAGLTPAPLFDAMKTQRDNRYLIGDKRDYFYVTAHGS